MFLSVIVATSLGREAQLGACLELLCRQSLAPDEVLVADDGSEGGRAVCAGFARQLPVRCLWRANDQSPARSRNLGAAAATGSLLVLLDSDVLLNPAGLEAYARKLGQHPAWLLYGYVGTGVETVTDSALRAGLSVNWRDPRFGWNGSRLVPSDKLGHSAYECAFAGNFALARASFAAIGGFDEGFSGWGGEDLDFGERAVARGFELHFLVDAWGEHQAHGRSDDFHRRPSEQRGHGYRFRPHAAMPYPVQAIAGPGLPVLEAAIREQYLPHERPAPP